MRSGKSRSGKSRSSKSPVIDILLPSTYSPRQRQFERDQSPNLLYFSPLTVFLIQQNADKPKLAFHVIIQLGKLLGQVHTTCTGLRQTYTWTTFSTSSHLFSKQQFQTQKRHNFSLFFFCLTWCKVFNTSFLFLLNFHNFSSFPQCVPSSHTVQSS